MIERLCEHVPVLCCAVLCCAALTSLAPALQCPAPAAGPGGCAASAAREAGRGGTAAQRVCQVAQGAGTYSCPAPHEKGSRDTCGACTRAALPPSAPGDSLPALRGTHKACAAVRSARPTLLRPCCHRSGLGLPAGASAVVSNGRVVEQGPAADFAVEDFALMDLYAEVSGQEGGQEGSLRFVREMCGCWSCVQVATARSVPCSDGLSAYKHIARRVWNPSAQPSPWRCRFLLG